MTSRSDVQDPAPPPSFQATANLPRTAGGRVQSFVSRRDQSAVLAETCVQIPYPAALFGSRMPPSIAPGFWAVVADGQS